MMTSMPLPDSPRLMMAMTGSIIGLVSGLILGLFAPMSIAGMSRSDSSY
jgi:hypothetical protein